MGLALTNPNDHRRVNAATRAIMKGKLSVQDAAAMILAGKSRKQIQTAAGTYIAPRSPAKQAQAAAVDAAPAQSKARKKQYAKTRRKLVSLLGKDPRYGRGYSDRFFTSAAGRYISKSKKRSRSESPKGKPYQGWVKGGGRGKVTQVVLNIPGVEAADKIRVERRKASGKQPPEWRQVGTGIRGNVLTRGGGKSKGTGRRKTATGRKAATESEYLKALRHIKDVTGLSHRDAIKAISGAKGAGMSHMEAAEKFLKSANFDVEAVANGLALTNPMMNYKALAMKAGVATVGAAAGVYVHSKVVPVVSEYYEKIPVIGEYLEEYDYAATGLLAGIALGGVAMYVGGDAGMYIGLLAGGVAAAGGALQVAEMIGIFDGDDLIDDEELEPMDEDLSGVFGGIALDNDGVFGGIALDNEGVFGGIALDNYGDGMAYELGGFSSPFDDAASAYGSAELADAQHAGADLDVAEGQAACAGPQEWMNRFGHPPHRVNAMGGAKGSASHLAGRRGHRWGWLIKMIGFKKFQQLAALPPDQRLRLIKKMRAAAISTMKQEMKARLPDLSPEFVSGQAAGAAPTMAGADTSYGGMLFAGDSAM
jgi:hypothetical protein